MASDQGFVEYVCDQMGDAGTITFRKMFGDYAVYCDGKVVALICDDQLFVKPTEGGRALLEEVVEGKPYPGAKPHLVIEEVDDREWLASLVRVTWQEVPAPRPKKTRKPHRRGDT